MVRLLKTATIEGDGGRYVNQAHQTDIVKALVMMVESESFRDGAGGGLVPIQIEMDDAMMTALVQRFDLMNQRGFLHCRV